MTMTTNQETPTMDSKYNEQAQAFLDKTNTKCTINYIGYGPHFDDDKESRNIYRVTLKRANRSYSFKFGDSIKNSSDGIEPTEYDVLSCLTKYDVGTFQDFCVEFGYDPDSRKALKTYNAVCREFKGVCRIWNAEEREQLAEIN
jgi:hypothetical protein